MATRIKLKIGAIEVEYEGEEQFIKEELPALIKAVAVLHEKVGAVPAINDALGEGAKPPRSKAETTLTTSSIATKLSSKTGSDLALAASARLALVESKPQFSRSDIVKQMKSATAFFKKNFVSNLSKILKTLVVADQLNEVGTDMYALSGTEAAKLKNTLGL